MLSCPGTIFTAETRDIVSPDTAPLKRVKSILEIKFRQNTTMRATMR